TRYQTWLPVESPPPAPAFTQYPRDGERVPPGPVQFRWRGSGGPEKPGLRLEVSRDPSFKNVLLANNLKAGRRGTIELLAAPTDLEARRWWRVVTMGSGGETIPDVPPALLVLAKDAPTQKLPPEIKPGPTGELVLHSLRGSARPSHGEVMSEKFILQDSEGTKVNGRDQMLVYSVPAWPEAFTVAVLVRIDEMPKGRIGQIFSAWSGAMDDPLRLVVEKGEVFARTEAGAGFATKGVPIASGEWHHVAAVKQGDRLALFFDGKPAAHCSVPKFSTTVASDCALGGNPHFGGNEFLGATFADFGFWARAMSAEELRQMAAQQSRKASRRAQRLLRFLARLVH